MLNLTLINQYITKGCLTIFGTVCLLVTPSAYAIFTCADALDGPAASDSSTGLQLINDLESKMPSLFSTTGFRDIETYKKELAQAGDTAAEISRLIEQEEFDVAMRAPQDLRNKIAESGFKNLHQTNQTRGIHDIEGRNFAEARAGGISYNNYVLLDPSIKPKYAKVRRRTTSKSLAPSGSIYGGDTYIFKKENIRHRAGFYIGDSLDRVNFYYRKRDATERSDPASWDQFLIPWKYRSLLVPDILAAANRGRSFSIALDGIDLDPSNRTIEEIQFLSKVRKQWDRNFSGYIEVQIYGLINLDDVEVFEFSDLAPTGDFLAKLIEKKIEIRDGRSGSPQIWTPTQ